MIHILSFCLKTGLRNLKKIEIGFWPKIFTMKRILENKNPKVVGQIHNSWFVVLKVFHISPIWWWCDKMMRLHWGWRRGLTGTDETDSDVWALGQMLNNIQTWLSFHGNQNEIQNIMKSKLFFLMNYNKTIYSRHLQQM